jgi:hypothetical protein
MTALIKAALVGAAFAAASPALAELSASRNQGTQITQTQSGMLNNQIATVGSVRAGSSAQVLSNTAGIRIIQRQRGLLNRQAVHVGSAL